MRYTIPGVDDWARRVYLNGQTRAERWRILLTGDRLRGVGRNPERPTPVHRERVRFGAWEGRPSRALPWGEVLPCACCQIPWAIPDEATRAAEARSGAGVGMGEGPADSDGSQTYKPGPLPVMGSVAWAEFGA